jgi:hypothetical protein
MKAARQMRSSHMKKVTSVLLLVAGLMFLAGCAGVSSGGNPNTSTTAGQLSPNASTLAFGNVTVGDNKSLSETITNTGTSSITISQVSPSGTGFSLSGVSAPVTLAAGQNATFSVMFAPSASGNASGSVTMTSDASNSTLTIGLSGAGVTTATGQLTVTPNNTLPIGNVVVGSSGSASGSLNAAGASVTVTAANSSNSQFVLSGLSFPVTIPAGESVPFTVTFTPATTGAASAVVTFISDAQTSSTQETVTGNGTAASSYSVFLEWTAPSSPNLSGYNIYRASYTSSCGSFAKINSSLNTSTSYTDLEVANSTSYCYATTAVNSSDEESGYSNIVSNVQIP